MSGYRIFHVWSGRLKAGKANLFAQWYGHVGQNLMASIPGVLSVQAYARQFGLGPGELDIEIWMEMDSYATYDRFDRDAIEYPDKYESWYEIEEFLEHRSSRVMGDFPASAVLPEPRAEQGAKE